MREVPLYRACPSPPGRSETFVGEALVNQSAVRMPSRRFRLSPFHPLSSIQLQRTPPALHVQRESWGRHPTTLNGASRTSVVECCLGRYHVPWHLFFPSFFSTPYTPHPTPCTSHPIRKPGF